MAAERLQKLLAAAGVASRRQGEELISAGRVTVNGEVVTELGRRADPEQDQIAVDGRPLPWPPQRPHLCLALYKPLGMISTARDPQGRPTVVDWVRRRLPSPERNARIYPVGRLDRDSDGLLLLTDDGDWAQRVGHPSQAPEKEYLVELQGSPAPIALKKLRYGVPLDDGPTAPARVFRGHPPEDWRPRRGVESTWLTFILHEGRNRQIRRMGEAVGHPVLSLRRVRIGPVTLAGLRPGQFRALTPQEVAILGRAVEGGEGQRGLSGRRRRPTTPDLPTTPEPLAAPSRRAGRGDGDQDA